MFFNSIYSSVPFSVYSFNVYFLENILLTEDGFAKLFDI